MSKSKKKVAEEAAEAALEAAQAFVDADPKTPELLGEAHGAIKDAMDAAEKAGTLDDHKRSIETAQAMLDGDDVDAEADAEAEAEAEAAAAAEAKATADAEAAAAAEAKATADAEAAAVVAAGEEAKYHHIAPGKALTSLKGILGEGRRVIAEDLPGGEATLKANVESGYIVPPVG